MHKIHAQNPDWKPGQKLDIEKRQMLKLDLSQISPIETYKLMIGSIVPRPIAFVSTLNTNGSVNLAPFSFFNGVGSNPPSLMFAIVNKTGGEKKDTLKNIEREKEFVVNLASAELAEPLNYCGTDFAYGESEMEKSGLTPTPSQKIKAPRVAECPIQMECELYNTMLVGDGSAGSSTIVVGKILIMHVDQTIYNDGKILIEKLNPLARLSGSSYSLVGDFFNLERIKI